MAHLFVQNRGEDLLGLCPREIFPTLQLTLNKYLSVSETVVEDLSDWSCLGLFPSELSASSENDLISAFFVGDLLLGRPFWAIPGKGESITDRLGSFSRQGAQYLKSKDLDVWRVEAGLPLLGLDVDETVFPIEANLQRAVHPHKGCYLGQEVIARLTNKGQARRRLIRLKLPFDVGLRGFVYFNDQEVGHVTSVVYSYRYNTWIGLALLLNMATNPGAHVEIKEMNKLINAEVF